MAITKTTKVNNIQVMPPVAQDIPNGVLETPLHFVVYICDTFDDDADNDLPVETNRAVTIYAGDDVSGYDQWIQDMINGAYGQ